MKLSQMPIVERLVRLRELLVQRLAALDAGTFAVSVDGSRQDDAMHALLKPVIERELRGRLASIDRDLVAHGVVVDHKVGDELLCHLIKFVGADGEIVTIEREA